MTEHDSDARAVESLWLINDPVHKTIVFEGEEDVEEYLDEYDYDLTAVEIPFVPAGGDPSAALKTDFDRVLRNYDPKTWEEWQAEAQEDANE